MEMCKSTPLEFETFAAIIALILWLCVNLLRWSLKLLLSIRAFDENLRCKSTPLEFETNYFIHFLAPPLACKSTPLEFETPSNSISIL